MSAVEASFALGAFDTVKRLLDMVGDLARGRVSQYVVAHATRFGARLASVQGDIERPEAGFKQAIGMFRELGVPLWMGATLLEFAEWLTAQDRSGEAGPLLVEAGQIFERLGGRPWLDRLTLLAGVTAGAKTSSAR